MEDRWLMSKTKLQPTLRLKKPGEFWTILRVLYLSKANHHLATHRKAQEPVKKTLLAESLCCKGVLVLMLVWRKASIVHFCV